MNFDFEWLVCYLAWNSYRMYGEETQHPKSHLLNLHTYGKQKHPAIKYYLQFYELLFISDSLQWFQGYMEIFLIVKYFIKYGHGTKFTSQEEFGHDLITPRKHYIYQVSDIIFHLFFIPLLLH